MTRSKSYRFAASRRQLAVGVALTFELVSPLASATVTSCDDGAAAPTTPGTLRYEVAHAAEGATVDFNLPPQCNSTITLETGALAINQNSLTIQGSAVDVIHLRNDINGAYNGGIQVVDRVIKHSGSGTLELSYLAISQGYYISPALHANGGCVYSSGAVLMRNATVSDCHLLTQPGAVGDPTHFASGGGLFSKGGMFLQFASITGNVSKALPFLGEYPQANCGGVYAGGNLTVETSTISDNVVTSSVGHGGGLCAADGGLIVQSTISGNVIAPAGPGYATTLTKGGGIYASAAAGKALLLIDSTISGNSAGTFTGGIFASLQTGLFASTIAFNMAGQGKDPSGAYIAAGVALFGVYTDPIASTLMAYNRYGSTMADFSGYNADAMTGPKTTIQGNNNLIVEPLVFTLASTITGKCPRLGHLADNGGPTKTHALLSFSPALDEGYLINLGFGDIIFDQRGLPRTSGPLPDIGAYEMQRDDIIFNVNFESCR